MSKYSFSQKMRTPKSLSLTASIALTLGVLGFMNLPVQTQVKKSAELSVEPKVQRARKASTTSEKMKPAAAVENSSAALLKLAESVGQSVPAKRLMEFRQKAGA